jgi:hypothetical protein
LVELLLWRVPATECSVLAAPLEVGLEVVAILIGEIGKDDRDLDRLGSVAVRVIPDL